MASASEGRAGQGLCPLVRWLTAFLVVLIPVPALGAAAPGPAGAVPPRVTADAAVVIEWLSGQILYEKNAFQRRPPASTTKVMTALLALERGRLSDPVRISSRAARTEGSSMHLRAGEVFTLEELLYGLLLNSGNDAAVAIAEHLAGSVEAFAGWMNARALELGALNTRFVNPHGLHKPGHYSTAYDLAVITRHALQDARFAAIVALAEKELPPGEDHGGRRLTNTNRLLQWFEGADGVKTGTTSAAGQCLVSSATRAGMRLLAVVLHADARWRESAQLLEWGFARFERLEVGRRGDVLLEQAVRGGTEPLVPLVLGEDLAVVAPKGSAERPQVKVELAPHPRAPVAAGQPLGTAFLLHGGVVRAQAPLLAAQPVARRTLLGAWLQATLPAVYWYLEWGLR